MPKKNRKSVEPVSLTVADAHFHPRDWEDYVDEVDEWRVNEKTNRYFRQARSPGRAVLQADFDYVHEAYIKEAAVDIANCKSEEACWDDVENGKLVLVGHLDMGDGRLWRIPKYVWTDPTAFENSRKGRVSGCGLDFVNVGILKASEAKNVPEFCGAKEDQSERPESPKVAKGTRGRKPKWDWKGASREIVTLASTIDGLPPLQAAIERHIKNWFQDRYDGCPAASQIRDFVVYHLPDNYRDAE